jgi:hypothetical protein
VPTWIQAGSRAGRQIVGLHVRRSRPASIGPGRSHPDERAPLVLGGAREMGGLADYRRAASGSGPNEPSVDKKTGTLPLSR